MLAAPRTMGAGPVPADTAPDDELTPDDVSPLDDVPPLDDAPLLAELSSPVLDPVSGLPASLLLEHPPARSANGANAASGDVYRRKEAMD